MSDKPKLLMLNPFYHPYSGGTEKHLFEVCPRLLDKFDVKVLTTHLPETAREEILYGVKVVRTPGKVLYKAFPPVPPPVPITPFQLLDLHREAREADIVHFHNRFVYRLGDTFLVKTLLRKKLCLTLHNARVVGVDALTDFSGQMYDDFIGRNVMRSCDAIAAVSRNTLDITLPEECRERAHVVYNGVNIELFNPKNEAGALPIRLGITGKRVISCVCRLLPQKGVTYLIQAMKKVVSEEPKAHLVVLGRGPLEEELKREADSLGISKNVTFLTEKLGERELSQLYALSEIFALSSLWEPFGMVICEAMASGKPVIGTKIGGIPEIITPDVGFTFEPKNVSQLSEKIILLLGDEKLRKRMGKEGRKKVEKKFNWDETARGYEKMYESILSN